MARSSFDPTFGNLIAGTAIISLFCAIAAYIPVFGFAFFFLLPLVVLIYRVRFGARATLIVTALSLMIMSVLAGGVNPDIMLMAGMLGHGFLLGKFVENHTSVDKAIAYSSVIILTAGILSIMVIGNFTGTGTIGLLSGYVEKNLEMTAALYKQFDASEESIRILDESIEKIHYALLVVLPGITAAIIVIAAWVNLLLGSVILERAGFITPVFKRLNLWQAPDVLVWGVIGCALLLVLPFQVLRILALNALIVMMTVYLLQGFAIISFYFDKKEVPLIIRIIIYGAVLIQQFLLLFIIGLGFFDTWLNLRRINATKIHTGG